MNDPGKAVLGRGGTETTPAGAFTLIELLVSVGIIALLIAILVPGLSAARGSARSVVCKSNLRSLTGAIHAYAAANGDAIVPSYNMTGVSTGVRNPLDGWGPILDKGSYVPGSREIRGNPLCCPDTRDIAGVAAVQTGSSPENPKGYMDWPAVITLSQVYATTIPAWGFEKIVRVGYWINGDNPIGRPQTITQGIHFTGSVGYGPDPEGKTLGTCYMTRIKKPSELIALADGLYAGRQEATRPGDRDSRIGYRHGAVEPAVNAGFADGHVGAVNGRDFPRKKGGGVPLAVIRAENLGGRPTVYADPESALRD